MSIIKYPRTKHIQGSRLQAGDEDLSSVPFSEIAGRHLVLEEKVDGANCGISFDQNSRLQLQSRGHYLSGGYGEKQFALLKTWASCFATQLYGLLGNRYILYGEWLYAKHTVFYDLLPHYFMEFDIFDKELNCFLSTERRREMLRDTPFVVSVRVLYEGKLTSLKELLAYLRASAFQSANWRSAMQEQCRQAQISYDLACRQSDDSDLMEGLYIKVETENIVAGRLEYVRKSFLTAILDSETHWANRPILPNRLAPGVDLFDPQGGDSL